MKIRLLAFGIAKDILQQRELTIDLTGTAVSDLRSQLYTTYPAFEKLKAISFAVNDTYQDGTYILQENDEVVLIPPVSGG